MGCNSMEMAAMGGLYRHCQVMQAGWTVVQRSPVQFSIQRERNVSPDTFAEGVATQMTDVPAPVLRFCVQLLLTRGVTTPSSRNTVKIKNKS